MSIEFETLFIMAWVMLEKKIMMDQPPPGKIYAPILCLEKLTNLSRDCFENIRWGRVNTMNYYQKNFKVIVCGGGYSLLELKRM